MELVSMVIRLSCVSIVNLLTLMEDKHERRKLGVFLL